MGTGWNGRTANAQCVFYYNRLGYGYWLEL